MGQLLTVSGRVQQVLVGVDPIVSEPRNLIGAVLNKGINDDRHSYQTGKVGVRDHVMKHMAGFRSGHPTFNLRQFSAVSTEELALIAQAMGIAEIQGADLGANLVISGIPDFTNLPIGTMLFFQDPEDHSSTFRPTVLMAMGVNMPCKHPGLAIAKRIGREGDTGLAASFVHHALGRRGIIGFVYSSGIIKPGDSVVAAIPDQKTYNPNASV